MNVKLHSREAEQVVLGCCMVEPETVMPPLTEKLSPGHFYFRAHRLIFKTLLEMYEKGQPIDLITLGNWLEEKGLLGEVGGRSYLSELANAVTTTTSAGYYAEIVLEKARQREAEQKALELQEAIAKGDAKAQAQLAGEIKLLVSGEPQGEGGGDHELIQFPEEVISGLARDFVRLYAEHTEVPPSFLFITFLTYLGHMLAYQVRIRSTLEVPPRVYAVLIGPSSDGRKSTALNLVDRFYRETFCDGLKIHYGLGSAEGLAQELEGENDEPVALLLHLDELKLLVDKCSQKGSIALPLITSLFERTEFDNITKGHRIRLRNAHLSLASACTVETFQTMWRPQFTDIGLVNRLFLVHGSATKRIFLPRPVPEEGKRSVQRELATLVGAINQVYKTHGTLPFDLTSEAERVFQDWYVRLDRSIHTRRLETYALRFALLFALNEGDTRIVSAEIAEKIIKLMEYELAVRNLYDPVDADDRIAAMEERIRRALSRRPMPESELKKHTNARRYGLWAFNAAKRNLIEAGEITFSSAKKRYYLIENTDAQPQFTSPLPPHDKTESNSESGKKSGVFTVPNGKNSHLDPMTMLTEQTFTLENAPSEEGGNAVPNSKNPTSQVVDSAFDSGSMAEEGKSCKGTGETPDSRSETVRFSEGGLTLHRSEVTEDVGQDGGDR